MHSAPHSSGTTDHVAGHLPSPAAGLIVLGLATAILASCSSRGELEIVGDDDGIPVTVAVVYQPDAFTTLAATGQFVRVVTVERRRIREPLYYANDPYGGYWVYSTKMVSEEHQPPIHAILLAGDKPGDDAAWTWPLKVGRQTTTVPIRPGHRLTVTLTAHGGYRGQLVIGTITPNGSAGQQVTIVIDREGARVSPVGVPGVTPVNAGQAVPPPVTVPPPAPASPPPPAPLPPLPTPPPAPSETPKADPPK